jgi:hypothetical protein
MRTLLALLLAASPAFAAPAFADGPLDATEFDALTLGRTMTWSEFGTVYGVEEYLPNRRVRWSAVGDDCKLGHWSGEGEAICFRYEDDPEPDCWIVTQSGSGLLARYLTNPPETDPVVVEDSAIPLSCPGPEVGV